MKGIRLVGVVLIMLLAVGSSIALAKTEGEAQDGGSPSSESEGLPEPTANSETFSLPDDQLETRIYPEPVNYRDEEGNWRPIGERLHETSEETLVNGPNEFDVTLPTQIDSKPVRFEVGEEWVESQLLRKDLEGAKLEGETATYGGEGNAPSFEFTGLSNGLKEEIELTGPGQANTFSYQLSASTGLQPSLVEDGSIQFRDSEGKTVVVLPAPVMSDSAGAESRAVDYELGPEEEGHWKLSVVADPEWLQQPDRVFPAVIDPTMTVGPALDCVIGGKKGETGWIDCASWGRKDLLIGYSPQLEAAKDNWWRTLMEFETTSIPVNSEITSATFNIRSLETALNTKGVELRQTTKPWTWKASWSRYDGPEHLWTTEGGDYSESLGEVLTATRGNQIGWWQFNMPAKLVEKEVNAEEWLGTIMKLIDDKVRECGTKCTERKIDFDSSAATTEANRPYLSVVYKAPAPIVTTEAASSVGETKATLKGQVNPHGYATTYQFEYGTTTSYGTKVPISAESVGSGKTNVALSKAISGLNGNTTYHYRVSATNAYGTTVGVDKTFLTPKLPTVTTEAASFSVISPFVAYLKGSVNPNGWSTTYQFEYGATASYGMKSPATPKSIGAGSTSVAAEEWIVGLKEATTYHYRLVASNAAGTGMGADKTLTTPDSPDTTITSPRPTYTDGAKPQITFTSDEPGVTYACVLDYSQPTCKSPYTLPEKLSPGWHDFAVAAVDSEGNIDPTPAEWKFNLAPYPAAPSTSKLTAPAEGEKTASYYTLAAEWGAAPVGGGVTAATFQMKLHNWKEFQPVPVECVLDGKGKQVSWPLAVTGNPGHSEPVFLKVRGCPVFKNAGYPEEDIKFRAVFDGGINAAGASEPITTEYVSTYGGVGAPTDATQRVGPVNLDLLTGQYTISRTDVSIPVPGSEANLEFARTYESNYRNQKVPSMVLGGMWQPSAPVEQAFEGAAWSELRERHENAVPAQYDKECEEEGYSHEECLIEEAIPAADWIELLDNEGGGASFEIQGGNYIAPEYMKEYVLTKQGSGTTATFELASPEGTHTVFVYNEVGIQGSYRPKSVSWQATAKSARMVYAMKGEIGAYRLIEMIAPAPSGVKCDDSVATKTAGCRTLTFQYFKCTCEGWERLSSITYYNSSGQESQAKVVAQYEYDPKYRLVAEWDPRIPPNLKGEYITEKYGYDEWYKMQSLTPSGQEPWKIDYYDWPNVNWDGRLKSVSRASLVESPKTAQTTVVYEVPISSGAPYDLSAASAAEWGQSDYPVNATAIFPPTEVPGEPPSDYSQAVVKYMDPDGYVVNTVSPQVPGVSGLSLATTETDRHGNVVRALSPQNRLLALAAGKESAVRSHQLDTQSTYSADGTEMLESLGPLHKVRLESGSTVEARAKSVIQYDQNATELPKDTPTPHLPTTETTSALAGKENLETRVTKTEYNWTLLKPTKTTVDAAEGGLKLMTRIAYDPNTGLPTERSLPAKPEGGDAHTTKTIYYIKEANAQDSSCGGNAAYAGLPCKTLPASQPGTAGLPELLITRYASYNGLDEPTEIVESPGGKEAVTRKTIKTYDEAGRPTTSEQVGGGTALPPTQTVYNKDTGLPVEQKFICKGECFSYASSFGSGGTGNGQFAHPGGIDIDASGNLWVVDENNHRVEKFNAKGEYLTKFGSYGTGNGQFTNATSVAVDPKGNIWVTDAGSARVEKFNEKGEYLSKFGSVGTGNGQFGSGGPLSIAVDSKGNLWVADTYNGRIQKFNEKGEFLAIVGEKGSGTGQLAEPTGIDVGPGNNVWVADWTNNKVVEFNEAGAYVRQFGSSGSGNGQFARPAVIVAGPEGRVWVGDQNNSRIQGFNEKGEYVTQFGSAGSGEGQFAFNWPMGIAVNGKGEIWVSDTGNNRVQKWLPPAAFDSQATVTAYDKLGRPIKYTDADGATSETTYDLLGRPVKTSDEKGTQTFGYDSTSGLLVAMEDSAAGLFTAGYNADGAMTERGLPNGLVAKTTYDEAGQPIKLTYTKVTSCSEKCTWLEESQERSIYGQILSQKSLASSQQYSYDQVGRLKMVKDTPTAGGCTTRAYAFDADSNRTSMTTRAPGAGGACVESGGTPQTYSYDAADRLTDSGIVYDDFGRITSLPAKDAGGSALTTSFYSNEMLASQSQGGLTNSYQLDATGRVRRVVQTGSKEGIEVFHYAMAADSTAWTERGSTWTRNIGGIDGGLTAIQESSGTTRLQLTNLHGDVVAIASLSLTANEPTANFEFDEFGNPKKGSAGRYGWLGGKDRRTELASGVIQMGVRSYVPALGRFLSTDPIPGASANAYDYANANPITGFDLTGTSPFNSACLPGFAGCKCKMWAKFKPGRRGRIVLTTVRKCNVTGGITLGGLAAGWGKGNGDGFHSIPPPRPVNAQIQPVCRPTDPCQNYQKHVREFYCEPGKEYEFSQTWEFQINVEGLPAHTLHVKIEQFCPK